ncbi:ABC transporter substrate-binding protein [Marinococcus sp. PL1-022]|uniref:ABC transporter substrate-binding protein n=1 Tax=Marinococcus sp. PL1-022 TaxID=3095363 RepID=UPI0029C4CF1D|nr:ABC transporter substrate-binding protein [Marinococcus sp. PL1-022]MDX6153655.1 ABC transporter substrate-binding protein [Marinococcus sp. PL1-022]
MKKAVIGSSLLVGGLVLSGCSFSSESSSGGEGEQINLDIFQGKVEVNEQFEELAAQYEEENPNVNVEVTSVGGGSDYQGSLKSKFSSGDEPAIFNIAGPTEAEQFSQYLADLSDMESAETALEGTLDPMKEDGNVHGLPVNQEGYGFIYNKNVFEEAGINAEDIQTYEDLEQAVQTLDEQKEELGIEEVFAYPAKEVWVAGNHLSNTFLSPEFDQNVTEAYNAESVEFNKGEEFKRILDLQTDYSIQPTLSLDYSQQVEEYFSQQQVAIIQQGNWVYPSVEQLDPEFAESGMGIMPIPVEGYEGQLPVDVPNYWAVNNNKDEETVQAAKDFLDWLNTSEAGKEAIMTEFNYIPAYEGYDTEQIADPLSKEIYEYSSNDNTIGWVFLGYPNGWGDSLGASVQKYLSGDLEWNQLEKNMKKEWEESRSE